VTTAQRDGSSIAFRSTGMPGTVADAASVGQAGLVGRDLAAYAHLTDRQIPARPKVVATSPGARRAAA
jgi:hypothetical protein